MTKEVTSYVEVDVTVRMIGGDDNVTATVTTTDKQQLGMYGWGNTESHAYLAFERALNRIGNRIIVAAIAAVPDRRED